MPVMKGTASASVRRGNAEASVYRGASEIQGGGVGPQVVYSSATHNVVWDGNSLVGPIVAQLSNGSLLNGLVVDGVGVAGQNIPAMTNRVATYVTPKFVAGKKNVLLVWEFTNSLCNNPGYTAEQAWSQMETYLATVKAGNPNWIIVMLTTLPRYGLFGETSNDDHSGPLTIAQANARLNAADVFIKERYRAAGVAAIVDVRSSGDFVYTGADTPLHPEFYLDTTHLNTAGNAVVVGLINPVLQFLPGAYADPKLVNAETLSGSPNSIVLTFSSALAAASVAASAFTINNSAGVDTVTNVAISGNTVTLTKSRASASSDTVSVTYTPPSGQKLTRSADGAAVPASSGSVTFVNQIVRNYLRLTTLTYMTEAANVDGYDYLPASNIGNYYSGNMATGRQAKSLPPSTDGFTAAQLNAVGALGPIVSLSASATPTSFVDGALSIYQDTGVSTTTYGILVGATNVGTGSRNGTPVVPAAGDIMRIRRTGSTLYAEVSKDNGETYTVIHSIAAPEGRLYPFYQSGSTGANGRIVKPFASDSAA